MSNTPAQGQARKRAPRRQDWMPNRMFDPVNNPFAIQNLLEREKNKEDIAFLPDADGRPEFNYAGNPLLRDADILPPKNFHGNQLLDEPVARDHVFQAEYEESQDDEFVDPSASDDDELPLEAAQAELETAAEPEAENNPEPLVAAEAELNQDDQPPAVAVAATAADTDPEVADETQPVEQVQAAEDSAIQASEDLPEEALSATDQALVVAEAESVAVEKPTDEAAADTAPERNSETGDAEEAEEQVASAAESNDVSEAVSSEETDVESDSNEAAPEAVTESASTDTEAAADTADEFTAEIHADALAEVADAAEAVADTTPHTAAEATPSAPDLNSEVVAKLIEAARAEAREEGRAAGREEVRAEAYEQGRRDAHEAAYQEGLEAGIAQIKEELQQGFDQKVAQLNDLVTGLQALGQDPDALFEPLKKLSVHLAEQLVRGELTQSPQTISRLVDNCLRELAASGEKAVIIHLNPEDLEQYRPLVAQFGDSIVLRPDALLARGSVRASLDGSVVEDLIERRIKGVKKSLAQPIANSWRPAASNPLPQRSQPVAPRAEVQPEVADDGISGNADDEISAAHAAPDEGTVRAEAALDDDTHSSTEDSPL